MKTKIGYQIEALRFVANFVLDESFGRCMVLVVSGIISQFQRGLNMIMISNQNKLVVNLLYEFL